jgi:uncharacterized protein (DUF1810 family)
MKNPYNLQRFERAQAPVYVEVIAQLQRGKKTSHWMWFIFPQIAGLGKSPICLQQRFAPAREFAIGSIEEAKAYIEHPILGARLRQCTKIVLAVEGRTSEQIFGAIDSLKFRSCMTLFQYTTADNRIFQEAIEKYFDNEPDRRTIEILQS